MVASLLAVGAAPAAAIDEDSEQDHTTTATACLGEALDDAGFTDLGGLEAAVDDINCLAYYEITTGKTADTFDPDSNVTRSQMALFLYRSAGVMGIDLMGGDMDADFGDIAELGEDRQNAINALARNAILAGRGDMAFDPGGDITRAEMAVALVNLVDHVSSNLGRNDAGLFVFGDDEDPPNDSFGDAYRTLSEPVNNAISAAYELGITTGRPAGSDTFAPNDGVPRRNMATFIMRALKHSNVRPRGLSAQIQTRPQGAAEIVVSLRDADFAPIVNVAIDAFRTPAAQEERAFKTDGTCSSRATRIDGASKCEIDGADPVTTSLGNIGLAQLSATEIGEGLTVWIWNGDVGDEYGNDTDDLEMSVDPQPEVAANATVAAISSDLGLEGNGDGRYGQKVTFTIQLQDGDENDAATPEGGIEYNLRLETFNGRVPVTSSDRTISVTPGEVALGSDGSGTFVVTARDLDADNDSEVTVRYTLSRSVTNEDDANNQPNLLVPGDGARTTTEVSPSTNPATYTHTKLHTGIVVFSDGDAEVTAVSVDVSSHQSAPSNGTVGTAATVTVLDQYGRPMPNEGIVLSSSATDDAVTSSRPRFTGPSGQVRIGYSYGGSAAVETLMAIWDGDTADESNDSNADLDPGSGEGQEDDTECRDIDDQGQNDGGNDICGSTMIFWVGLVTDENSTTETTSDSDQEITGPAHVLSLDADNQQLVIDGDDDADDDAGRAPVAMDFDSNDFFTVDGSPSSLDDFSEMLAKALAAFEAAGDVDAITEAEPTLVWADYVHDDSSSSAWFQLVTNLDTNDPQN